MSSSAVGGQALQASADASAAAGAGRLTLTYPPVGATATTEAQRYGSQAGGQNPITGVPSANVTQSVSVTCAPQAGDNCTTGHPNTVTVNETANVPTYLLKLQNMAGTGSGTYFYDLPNPTSLTGIFQQIAADITGGSARIVQ